MNIACLEKKRVLAIIVPCYNEEEVLPTTAEILANLLHQMVEDGLIHSLSFICFVNDGSSDFTWKIIIDLIKKSMVYRGINLSRNFGHQAAVLAGLFTVHADAYVSIDADLQDDYHKIRDMVRLYLDGNDIVYGCRNDRSSDTWFKRITAEVFYKVRSVITRFPTIPHHADFRLMSVRAVDALKKYRESNLYLRGIVLTLGFPAAKVFYARSARTKGISKYPFRKMLKLALDGMINFSEAPLIICLWLGCVGFLFSLLLIFIVLLLWFYGQTLPGWTSLVLVVSTFGSMQFIFTGIIGLYVGKIFTETKRRPSFIIQDDFSQNNRCG